MLKTILVFMLKIAGGLLIAGAVLGILVPLLPGMIEPWMVALIAVISVAGLLFATSDGRSMPPG